MMIEQNDCQEDCGCKKSYSSGDFKQQGTSAYNYNVLSVNCEQDWKVSGHCLISVVSSRNIKYDNASYSLFELVRHSTDLETPMECPKNCQQLKLSCIYLISGDLRPGSVFLARAPRFRGPAPCGFVVCVIIT